MRHFHDDDDDEFFDFFMMDEMDREDAWKKSQKKHFPDKKEQCASGRCTLWTFSEGQAALMGKYLLMKYDFGSP